MKKVIVLLLSLLMLVACVPTVPLSDSEKFIIQFKLYSDELAEEELNVKMLEKYDDLKQELKNGTHIVLLASAEDFVNEAVFELMKVSLEYEAIRIYHFDYEKLNDKQLTEVQEIATPYASDYDISNPMIYFMKNGEVTTWFDTDSIEMSSLPLDSVFKEAFDEIANTSKPGCNEC